MALITSLRSTTMSICQKLIELHVTNKIPLAACNVKLLSTFSSLQSSTFELPKKPKTAYFQFSADAVLLLNKADKMKSPVKLAPILGEKWNQLPEVEKQVYLDRHAQEYEEYKKKMADIQNDPKLKDQLVFLEQEKLRKRREKAANKARRDKRELMKNLGQPKKPSTAYMLYFAEQKKNGANEGMKQIADLWKLLNEGERKKYDLEAKAMKEKYKVELEAWKVKMLEDDQMDGINNARQKVTAKRTSLQKLNK